MIKIKTKEDNILILAMSQYFYNFVYDFPFCCFRKPPPYPSVPTTIEIEDNNESLRKNGLSSTEGTENLISVQTPKAKRQIKMWSEDEDEILKKNFDVI